MRWTYDEPQREDYNTDEEYERAIVAYEAMEALYEMEADDRRHGI